jgi:multimeric flavodoxin WrbA
MKILVLSGSRNPQGKTAQAIDSIHKGIMTASGESECLFLPGLNLKHCRQCESDGWRRTSILNVAPTNFIFVVD